MKFSVGDPVYIKSNKEEGVIVEIIDQRTAKVKAQNSEFHVFFEDLEHPYLNWFLQQNKQKKAGKIFIDNIQAENGRERPRDILPGVSVVCFPQYKLDEFDEFVSHIKIYLYNETDREFSFSYGVYVKQAVCFELDNQLLPKSSFYVHDMLFEQMAAGLQFTLTFTDRNDPQCEEIFTLPLKPKKFFAYLDKIRHENHAFFSLPVFEKLKPRPIKEVENISPLILPNNSEKKSHFDFHHALKKTKYEVDLHIEKLVTDPHRLSKSEKLTIQLNEFQKALELASITHQRSIVFIHGVGKGVLKAELHKILLQKKQTKIIKDYVNNYDVRYGFGATEVFF